MTIKHTSINCLLFLQLLSLSNQMEANTKAINLLLKSNENREKETQDKLRYCDAELICIRKDLSNFNQVNKDFLEVVKRNELTLL